MPTDPTTTPTTPAAARVTIRRATPADAAHVVAMVKAIADLEDQAAPVDAQRFYRRLGAALRPKILAAGHRARTPT